MQLRLPRPHLKAPSADSVAVTAVAGLAVAACVAVYVTWRFSKLLP